MSNCNRLPGFSHFESSLSNSLCGFDGLDIRFVTDEVGLPPPYPGGPNICLDLSSVNGLDLSSSQNYEGLNLSQQCLNLSSSNVSRVPTSSNNTNVAQHQQQAGSSCKQNNQHHNQQPEMVLNLSTQMGLNLTRNAMPSGDYNMYQNFEYYNSGYYENGFNNTAGSAASTATQLCQMEEQRCSPLNLEHRSSPLNLTSVGNIQRKRNPTPGQAMPLNMGIKMNPLIQSQGNLNLHQQENSGCNNQVFDYRIPNKLTAFYNQQNEGAKQNKVELQSNHTFQSNYNSAYNSHGFTQKQVILAPVNKCNGGYNEKQTNNPQASLCNNHNQNIPDLYFSNGNYVESDNIAASNLQQSNSKRTNNFDNRANVVEKPLPTIPEKNSQIQEQLLPFDSNTPEDFLFQDDYGELNYSYSDALNFAAEAMSDNSPSKLFEGNLCQAKLKEIKEETVSDLSTNSRKSQLVNCNDCSAQFSSNSDLKIHTDKHHKEKHTLFPCSICKINFYEESQLLSHNKLCHDSSKSKSLNRKQSSDEKQPMNMTLDKLQSRENTPKKKVITLPKVPKNKSQAEIKKLRDELAKDPFPFQCITCAKKFQEKSELIQHLYEHNEMKPFKCEICNQGFTHLSAKKRHEKAHTSEKPHQCLECPKAFFRKSDLSQHLKVHSKDKYKFACADCGQMMKTEKKLKEHLCSAKSANMKQLKCSICEKVLTSKVTWGVHMWKHTKDSAFIITSESDPWPVSLLNKLPLDLAEMNILSNDIDNIQPLNMQAVPT